MKTPINVLEVSYIDAETYTQRTLQFSLEDEWPAEIHKETITLSGPLSEQQARRGAAYLIARFKAADGHEKGSLC